MFVTSREQVVVMTGSLISIGQVEVAESAALVAFLERSRAILIRAKR